MGFESLLGNRQLKENLSASLKNNHISHFYLISGPEGSGKRTLAKLLSAAVLCKGNSRPCGRCGICRRVMEGNHPDAITVDDPEKRFVSVDLIRSARADIYIKPNESDHKIYLIPRAQDMLPPAQNALLKILEEPPEYGVFLLLTDNPEKLLPTVRSRCVELKLGALDDKTLRAALVAEFPDAPAESVAAAMARSGGFLGQAKAILEGGAAASPQTEKFARAFAQRDVYLLVSTLAPMEKWKRDDLIEELSQWRGLLVQALESRSGIHTPDPRARDISTSRSAADILAAVSKLETCITYAQGNVSPAAICGYLSWELR